MRIWLLTIGEPIRSDSIDQRLYRTGQYANWLVQQGHDVTFFNSTFDHMHRRQRFSETTEIQDADGLKTVCLYARPYKSSMSFTRFGSHKDVAQSFKTWLVKKSCPVPDVIVASYPIEELCRAAASFAEAQGIPLVMDCRDMWPDIFMGELPRLLRLIAALPVKYLDRKARKTLSRANAISGHTEPFMQWGVRKAGREKNPMDMVFPFTYEVGDHIRTDKIHNARAQNQRFQIVFLGQITRRCGLDLILDNLKVLAPATLARISIKIAGRGGHLEHILNEVSKHDLPVEYLGWLDKAQISALMCEADFGLLPYQLEDFHDSIPNKFVEYLSHGLPILSCTAGCVQKTIEQQGVGIWFDPTVTGLSEVFDQLTNRHSHQQLRSNARMLFADTYEAERVFSVTTGKLEELIKSAKLRSDRNSIYQTQ
jgi:glycosyltransferase involved in cell wall biosynthesis